MTDETFLDMVKGAIKMYFEPLFWIRDFFRKKPKDQKNSMK